MPLLSGGRRLAAAAAASRRTGRSWSNCWPRKIPRRQPRRHSPLLRQGAGTVVTGQQVGLFGGPLFTPFKAATALARARQATAAGHPHARHLLAGQEDHDFAEINHVTFPAAPRTAQAGVLQPAPDAPRPVGGIGARRLDHAARRCRPGNCSAPPTPSEALAAAYQPGRTFAQAFADFYSAVFAAQGLLVLDAGSRDFHRLGAPVLRAAMERADELHAALLERNAQLEAAGYHAQVAVTPQSSLLFLIDEANRRAPGARSAPLRAPPSPTGFGRPGGKASPLPIWSAFWTPSRSASRPRRCCGPVFQDFLLSTSLIIGGPAEIAYFAQSAVLYERILGRQTPAQPRFSATLIEPAIAELLANTS